MGDLPPKDKAVVNPYVTRSPSKPYEAKREMYRPNGLARVVYHQLMCSHFYTIPDRWSVKNAEDCAKLVIEASKDGKCGNSQDLKG